jgi:predicted TIM-barrel fold metal-dependent hydrolase
MNDFIDTNVYLSRWPFRRVEGDEPRDLVLRLRAQNVTQAWAGSFDGLFHRDMAGVNERLAHACAEHGKDFLLPFGSINPKLPDWEEDLRRCHEQHKMRGIRLHPNYHGYTLDEPLFAHLLHAAMERNLIVQLAISMEDERTQPALAHVPHVDTAPLTGLLKDLPKLRLVLLNAFRGLRVAQIDSLVAAGDVCFDIAMLEGVGGVANLIAQAPLERILFGSYYPFFYFESSLLKLDESGLAGFQRQAISAGNARRLLS